MCVCGMLGCVCVCVCSNMYRFMYINICMCVCVCVCVCVYIHTHDMLFIFIRNIIYIMYKFSYLYICVCSVCVCMCVTVFGLHNFSKAQDLLDGFKATHTLHLDNVSRRQYLISDPCNLFVTSNQYCVVKITKLLSSLTCY